MRFGFEKGGRLGRVVWEMEDEREWVVVVPSVDSVVGGAEESAAAGGVPLVTGAEDAGGK